MKILLYSMYGTKLKTFVSSASLLLLFKKGLRSKTKYKTTFIRISAVQFESFFKHVQLCSISILFNGQSLKWLNVSAPDNVNCRTPSFAHQLSMNKGDFIIIQYASLQIEGRSHRGHVTEVDC